MGKIADAIKLLSKATPVGSKVMLGSKISFESAHGDGEVREYTVESYDKKEGEVTLSREVGDHKVLLKLPIKIDSSSDNDVEDYEAQTDNRPSAVFTASGKLVYLIS
ncbi:MAG TPA: hypothetical protein VFN51_03720 [Candidatus Saccharimonadales bacterium]|nr:hypothetical protein [Candidatus Saccharimonadales bacterium]